MQQIINFDIALNYLPYRYRHRSNTRSKRTKVSVQRKSYSRSKIQKDSTMKNIQTSASNYKMNQKSPFSQDFLEGNHEWMKGQDLFARNRQYYGVDKLQYSRTPSIARRQQQQELEQTPNSQFSFSNELQQPQTSSNMRKDNFKEDKIYETDENEYKPFSLEIMKQNSGKDSSRVAQQEIFDQQDMREIKQALMNKIKQNQFLITDSQASKEKIISSSKKQMEHLQQDQAQKELSLPKQEINFDERYNRLQAINQLSEEHFEKQRKAKIVQIMKKGEKVAQNYYNKYNKRIKDTHQQRLNNFSQISNKPFIDSNINDPIYNNIDAKTSTQVKQSSPKMRQSGETATQEKTQQKNKNQSTPKSHEYNSAKFTEQIKQQSNNYSSLQTSSASQKQQSISSQRPNQGDTSYRMMKKQSSKKLQIKPFVQECLPLQIQRKDPIKCENNFHKRHLQKTVIEPSRQQIKIVPSQPQQHKISSFLDSFSIPASNNSIKKIKEARSKEKQQLIQRYQINSFNKIDSYNGYSHGSNNLQAYPSNTNGYAINMKKRKELVKPTLISSNEYLEKSNFPQSTEGLHNIYPYKVDSKMFQMIKEDSIENNGSSEQSYQPKYALKKQAQFIIKIQPSPQDSFTNRYNPPVSYENIEQNIQLSSQGRQQLLEAHLQLCFTPRSHQLQSSPLPSNRASQGQFSLPVSRVLSHQKDSEHKLQDNQRILRMMMRDQDIGELSSFMEAEHQSNHQVNSSMTQQLCHIINSNEEQGSNISQKHLEGSNSSQFSDNKMDYQVEMNRYNHNNDEIIEQDNYRINSPQNKYRNFDEQILNVLNMQEFQDEYSQIPSRGMEVSGGSQNACSSSLLAYKGHFHPYSQAIRKFKHSKHSSADVRNKSINSFANTHSQSAKKRIQAPSEASKKTKSRRQINAIRFKTRMTPN